MEAVIKSKTYNTTAGLNYIEAPELVLTQVYAVKLNGTQYDKYISGDANRTHVYNASEGRIYVPVPFSLGDRVFVIYEETSPVPAPIPGVCTGVTINPVSLPDGLVTVPYSQGIALAGSEPFSLNVNTKPSWMSITLAGSVVTLSGTPDTEATETVDFDVSNCSGGSTDNFTDIIEVIDNTTNFAITNLAASGVKITKVIPKYWVTQSGAFPVQYGATMLGAHGGFTASLGVFISGVVFQHQVSLIKNGAVLQAFTVEVNDQYTFDEQTFLNTDDVAIILN